MPTGNTPLSLEEAATLDDDVVMKAGTRAFTMEFTEDTGSLTINPVGETDGASMEYTLTLLKARLAKKVLGLLKKSGYVPQVVEHIEKRGVTDPHAQRALTIELRNCLREIHKAARTAEKETKTEDKQQDTAFVGNIEKELQKEYPAVIKKTLTEFQSLRPGKGRTGRTTGSR